MKKFLAAAALVALFASASEAKCGLFKGRLRHAAHRVADAPFKVASGVKSAVKGPAKAAPCANGTCPAKK